MTRNNSYLTESQEQAFHETFNDVFHNEVEFKNLTSQIEMEPMTFSFSNLDNLSQEYPYINGTYQGDQNSLSLDDKLEMQNRPQEQNQCEMQREDHQMHQHQLQQLELPTQTPILNKGEFAGEYNFQLLLNPQNNTKHCVYSEKLQKVFIHMEEVLPLQFQWSPPADGLWLRATMVYKLDHHRSEPVVRCHNHMAFDNNSNRNIDPNQIKHVIRCLNNTSTYEEAKSGHLSVLTPLGIPEVGLENVPMDFKLYCKNSCTSGMNRRPTEIIFTLETDQSIILGRRKLEVRVCSCPKRDKEKEELELNISAVVPAGKKRKVVNHGIPPPGKKISTDCKVYNINLNIVGRDNMNSVLKYAHDVMAGSAVRIGNIDLYKPYMDEVLRKYQ